MALMVQMSRRPTGCWENVEMQRRMSSNDTLPTPPVGSRGPSSRSSKLETLRLSHGSSPLLQSDPRRTGPSSPPSGSRASPPAPRRTLTPSATGANGPIRLPEADPTADMARQRATGARTGSSGHAGSPGRATPGASGSGPGGKGQHTRREGVAPGSLGGLAVR